ncbi:MAG: DegT/DnrJ/EryC1/StrS family aminotransferase [Verrucomicrobiota bacterium]
MKKSLRRAVKPAVRLTLQGGPKVRNTPWPNRHLIGLEEKSAVDALFDRAIASGNAFGYGGPEEEAYCREFADAMGGGFADAVNSGTTAVYVALRALNPEPFSEVIVGPITDPGGIMPIPLLNCIPVIADAAPGRFSPGPKEIEAVITPRTSAIVVAHIFGEPADMPGIMKVARRHKLPVVEDCAQAHGARLKGRLVGTFGDIAVFSTMFGKHHCTGGQGGVVFTRHEKLYKEARRASDRGKPFGLPKGADNAIASLNFNLSDLAAVIGSVQLRKLPMIVSRRRELASRIAKGLRGLKAVSLPPQVAGAKPSYWYLRLRFNPKAVTCDKATFCRALTAEGVYGLAERYINPCHMQDWYRRRRVFGTSGLPWTAPQYRGNPDRTFPCPNALAALDAHFILTLFESWGNQEAADIVAILQKVARAYERST